MYTRAGDFFRTVVVEYQINIIVPASSAVLKSRKGSHEGLMLHEHDQNQLRNKNHSFRIDFPEF